MEPKHAAANGRFTAPGLADQAERFTLQNRKRHAVHSPHNVVAPLNGKMFHQIADLYEFRRGLCWLSECHLKRSGIRNLLRAFFTVKKNRPDHCPLLGLVQRDAMMRSLRPPQAAPGLKRTA